MKKQHQHSVAYEHTLTIYSAYRFDINQYHLQLQSQMIDLSLYCILFSIYLLLALWWICHDNNTFRKHFQIVE